MNGKVAALPSDERFRKYSATFKGLLALHDRITDSMDFKQNSSGLTNPTECGSSFTTMKVSIHGAVKVG